MPENKIRVIAHIKARPDRIEDTREALTALIAPTRAEDGCILYELMQNNSEPTDFTFVEEWTSDAALDAHLKTRHLQELQARGAELLASPPDIRRYTLIA